MEVNQTQISEPKRSSLPDLSTIFRHVTLNYLLNMVFFSAGTKDEKVRIFLPSYIRLVDKSLEEYEQCRINFEAFVYNETNSGFDSWFRAIGHMENCFYSITRTIRLAIEMGNLAEMRDQVSSLSILQKNARTRIEKIRNSIEHMDERVRNMKIKVGDLSTLYLSEDYVELGKTRIEYSELAIWLTELHALSQELAKHGSR